MNEHYELFASMLRQSDLKVTKARVTILEILNEIDSPADVETIQSALKKHHVSADLATVYRNLDTLSQSQIINRIDFQEEGKFRYELQGGHHHHLVCDVCGKVEAIETCVIDDAVETITHRTDFQINRHSLEFFGVCKNCQ